MLFLLWRKSQLILNSGVSMLQQNNDLSKGPVLLHGSVYRACLLEPKTLNWLK